MLHVFVKEKRKALSIIDDILGLQTCSHTSFGFKSLLKTVITSWIYEKIADDTSCKQLGISQYRDKQKANPKDV